nr:MAG TPA: hypothetical protein [Caudoviricetes sp.]
MLQTQDHSSALYGVASIGVYPFGVVNLSIHDP